jgi:predicted nucleotidyltransferase
MFAALESQRDAIEHLCRRFGVRRLAVFGSATRDTGMEPRDVDFLVEFDPGEGISRFEAYFGLKEALEDLLGKPVDLVSPAALENPSFAATVTRAAQGLYAA